MCSPIQSYCLHPSRNMAPSSAGWTPCTQSGRARWKPGVSVSSPVMGKHVSGGNGPAQSQALGLFQPVAGPQLPGPPRAAWRCRAGQGVSLRVGHLPSPELSLLGEACASQGEAAALWGAGEPRQVSGPRFSRVLATLPTERVRRTSRPHSPPSCPWPRLSLAATGRRSRWVLRAGSPAWGSDLRPLGKPAPTAHMSRLTVPCHLWGMGRLSHDLPSCRFPGGSALPGEESPL